MASRFEPCNYGTIASEIAGHNRRLSSPIDSFAEDHILDGAHDLITGGHLGLIQEHSGDFFDGEAPVAFGMYTVPAAGTTITVPRELSNLRG